MAENERYLECKLGSTIQLLVPRPLLTTWSFNGKDVTIPYDHKKGFIKRNADLKDSGRYECKEDCIVTLVINVTVYDILKCDLGSTIHIEVNTGSICQTWTVNDQAVKSEIDPFNGFEKRNADISDSGIYKCRVDGRVKNFFYVTVYDFNIGRIKPIRFTRKRKVSLDSEDEMSFEELIPFVINKYEYMNPEEKDQISSIYLVKEEEDESHQTTYYYEKIFHEYYYCKVGSDINLKYTSRSQFVSPTWTLDEKDVISECNPRDGFTKKKSVLKDSGKYECKENNIVKRIFDVFVYDTYEFKFGSTIHLGIDMTCMDLKGSEEFKWTLNGEDVSSECDKHKGFEKTNADFTDSGKYILKVDKKVTNVFEAIVYEYLFGDECLGIRITVPGEAAMMKPDILSKQIQTDKCGSSSLHGTAIFPVIDRTDKTGKWRNFIYSIGDQFMSIFKTGIETKGAREEETKGASEEETKSEFEEVTKYATEKETNGTFEGETKNPATRTAKYRYVSEWPQNSKRSTNNETKSVQEWPQNSKRSMNSNIKPFQGKATWKTYVINKIAATLKTCMGSMNKKKRVEIFEYSMNRKQRGIAVIITIGKFDSPDLDELIGLENDIGESKKAFHDLHFDVKVCEATTTRGVEAYLTYIAEICHKKYDCFMLLFGSHGGKGFVCCSDFNNTNATGFIEIHDLIKQFAEVKSLDDKPKIFFFDSCQQANANIEVQSPIRAENNTMELSQKYSHVLLGFAAIEGTSATGTIKGGIYTQELARCLRDLANTTSLTDVMAVVNRNVCNEAAKLSRPCEPKQTQVSNTYSTLQGRIIMRNLNRYGWHFLQYSIYTVLALLFCFLTLELCPF